MTVEALIAALRELPPDATIVVPRLGDFVPHELFACDGEVAPGIVSLTLGNEVEW